MSKVYRICPRKGSISAIVGYTGGVFTYGSANIDM